MKFYRYDVDYYESGPKIILLEYELIKETLKGYWINRRFFSDGWVHKKHKWISKTSRKRFAYPTKEEAMVNFKTRKESQIKILTSQLEYAKAALLEAENINLEEIK